MLSHGGPVLCTRVTYTGFEEAPRLTQVPPELAPWPTHQLILRDWMYSVWLAGNGVEAVTLAPKVLCPAGMVAGVVPVNVPFAAVVPWRNTPGTSCSGAGVTLKTAVPAILSPAP